MGKYNKFEKWAGTMTDRERFNAQINFKPADRCFNMEFGYWQENYEQWDIFTENDIKHEGQANEFFGFDSFAGFGGNTWMSPPFPSKILSDDGKIIIQQNGDGLIAEIPKDGHDTIPHYIKASVVTPEDWKKVKEERFRRDDPARKVDIEAMKAWVTPDRTFPVGVGTGSMIGMIRNMLTFEGLIYACYDYPDMVEDMVETACVLVEDFLDAVLPHAIFDYASGWEDICFKNGPIISLDFARNILFPRYKRIGDRLKKHGIKIWFTDCDGDVRPLLPVFLEAGINCMFPYEVNSCVHPGEILDMYPGELRIMGGVDKMQLIAGKDAIKAYLESIVPYVERGGFIPFCDHRCPPDVTPENYVYYLNLKKEMFGLK